MDKEKALELIKKDIRDSIFGEFEKREVDEGLNKSKFKEIVTELLKEQYKDTSIKFDLVIEGDKIIAKPYYEYVTLQFEV